jgi:hypothetical protein
MERKKKKKKIPSLDLFDTPVSKPPKKIVEKQSKPHQNIIKHMNKN